MIRDKIEKYINEQYTVMQEYPWKEDPNSTTFKHIENKKWFALIMNIPYKRLNIDKEQNVNIINLKNIPEIIGGLRMVKGIYPAYHMNKEHWITVLLDGTIDKEKIIELIDMSYELTKGNNIKWRK